MTRAPLPGIEAPDPILEEQVRARLGEVEEALAKAVVADSDLLAETAEYLLAAGGKRFRPMLVLLGGYFGDPADTRLIPGAVSIELVHLATLYHDDVIDEADSRRGTPSVNARWDNTVAILTGDYLFARASEISCDLGTDITRLLARTIGTVCDGQVREVSSAGSIDQTLEEYMVTIQRKTSALIATSCRIGGMLSDAPPDYLDILEEFGDTVGTAFQLSDDIMDITSSAAELGKEPGVDIKEGVYTLPVLHALTVGDAREQLRVLLADGPPSDDDRLQRALELVRSDGSIAHARDSVGRHVARAIGLAERLPSGPARDAMISLAHFLANRCGAKVS